MSLSRLAAVAFLAAIAAASARAAPNVVTTIKPLNALVAAVTGDVTTPYLIVKGAGSPHTYALKPADAAAMQSADIIFRNSTNLENFLNKAVETLPGKADIVVLTDAPDLQRLHLRATGSFETDADELPAPGADPSMTLDPHAWLDPRNAAAMVGAIAAALAKRDPEHAADYAANARAEAERLRKLEAEISDMLEPVKGKGYVVFHDAYQYFEHRFGLAAAGSIVLEPDAPPGARRIAEMRAKVKALGATCVFAEPEFEPRLVNTVIEGTRARAGVLDPLGAELADGPDLYFALLRNLAASLRDCLAGNS